MSSYLNFYLVPKRKKGSKVKPKPLLFNSYSRGSRVYQHIYEELHPAYIGNDDIPKYSEITATDIKDAIDSVTRDIDLYEEKFNTKIEIYKSISDKVSMEEIEDLASTKDYIKSVREDIQELEGIYNWMVGLEYTDFETKVLINYD